ncbi:MAG: DUF58 domain-containing protein [Anaerolineae bacterium]
MFDFEEAERELFENRTRPAREDTVRSLLDHRWVGMALLLFVVGALARNMTLMTMTGFMLVIVTVAWLWSRGVMREVVYLRRFRHRRVFPGEENEAQIIVENRKLLPLGWLRVEDEWPVAYGPTDENRLNEAPSPDLGFLTNTYTLRWYQRIRRRIPLLARRRGIYQVGPAFGLSGDPFNLFERGKELRGPEYLIVYPEIKPIDALGLPMKDPLGDVAVRQRLFEDPNRVMGVRDHRPEDDLRHIHWKATARAGSLQTRVYEPTRSVSVTFCLNVATFEQHWHGFWPEMLEYLVSTTASLAAWAVDQQYAVGVVANSTLAHADQPFRVLPGRSRDQLMHILETLAGVSYIVTQDFGQFVLDESPKLPWGTTLVMVTAFITPAIAEAIVRLRDSGRRVVIMALGKEKPEPIQGVLMHHLPIASEPPDLQPADEETMTPRDRFLRDRARQEAGS